jgi:ADP-heptose:LPS heptosyltransferase
MKKFKRNQKRSICLAEKTNNIIIRLPNFIGDSIMSTSAIQLLVQKYPNAKLTIVCKRHTKDIFIEHNSIKNIIIDDSKTSKCRIFYILSLIREIRKEKYDLGVLFHNSFLNALIFKLSRIKVLIGYDKECRKVLLDYYDKFNNIQHYINRYAGLVNNYLQQEYMKLPATQIWNRLEDNVLDMPTDKPVIALNLGNDYQKYRAYPCDLSKELIDQLSSLETYRLVLIGDWKDAERAKNYGANKELEAKNVYNLTNKTTVSEYVNVVRNSDLLITIDSSAMHIAAAVSTPFITILGKSTSAFCTVKPKIEFGTYLKEENELINEELYISQIEPKKIVDQVELVLADNSTIKR